MHLTPRMANRLFAIESAAGRVDHALRGDNPAELASASRDYVSACHDAGKVARAEGHHGLAAALTSVTRYPL